jgi:hypothetical protein
MVEPRKENKVMGRSNPDFGQSPLPMKVSPHEIERRKATFEVSLLSLSSIAGLGRKGLKALVKEFGGEQNQAQGSYRPGL